MATFLNFLLLVTVLALTKFSTLSAELNELSNKQSAIKVARSMMPEKFLESDPGAGDEKIGDQRNWEDRLSMKRNWDELSSWGKRGAFDNHAVDNEFETSLRRALNSHNVRLSSLLDGAELKKRWDNLQAWGKRNSNGNDAAYGKTVKRDYMVKLSDGTWKKITSADGDKRGTGWDEMSGWGKRSAAQHKIRSRNWDSLQAWGKRESPSDDSALYENNQLQKRSAGKIL